MAEEALKRSVSLASKDEEKVNVAFKWYSVVIYLYLCKALMETSHGIVIHVDFKKKNPFWN